MDLSPAADPSPAFPVALPPHAHLAPEGRVHLRADVEIREVREEGGYALAEGIAYPALVVAEGGKVAAGDAFRIDTYKTWMSPETLRTFAHRFLERGTGGIDSQHDHGNVGCIVESWYQRDATDRYPADVWVAVVKVLKADAIEGLRTKKLRGFSIEFVGKYRDAPLEIESVGRVRTAEIVDPYPITLSLVDKPATRLPFAEVTQRAEAEGARAPTEPAARTDNDADDGRGRAVLVRFDPPAEGTPGDTPTMPTKTAAGAARTDAPAADPTPAAVRAEGDGAPVTPAATETPAADATPAARTDATAFAEALAPVAAATTPEARRAALRAAFKTLTTQALADVREPATPAEGETRAAKRSGCDWSDLASVFEAYGDRWELCDTMERMLYAAMSVFWECVYCAPSDDKEALAAKVSKLAADLNGLILAAVADFKMGDEGEAAAEVAATNARSAQAAASAVVASVRAGKTLSKKNRERIQGAYDSAEGCMKALREMLDETAEAPAEGETPAEGEAVVQQNSAPAEVAPATPAPAAVDPVAAMRAEIAAETAKLRAEFDARTAEATAAMRKELDAATARATDAEARAAALEAMPAPTRSHVQDPPAAPPAARTEKAPLPFGGGILGLRNVMGSGVTPVPAADPRDPA